jgi:hypothetical protein
VGKKCFYSREETEMSKRRKLPADPRALKKIVEDLEKISIDEEVLEKNSGLLNALSEGVVMLDAIPIPLETEPFFFRPTERKKEWD